MRCCSMISVLPVFDIVDDPEMVQPSHPPVPLLILSTRLHNAIRIAHQGAT